MVSPFAAAFRVVEQAARDLAGELVTYRRASDEIEITAIVGSHPEQTVDANGMPVTVRRSDFIIAVAAIDFGAGPVPPMAGDEIERTVNGSPELYRVQPTRDDRGYRRGDPDEQVWRIHADRVS